MADLMETVIRMRDGGNEPGRVLREVLDFVESTTGRDKLIKHLEVLTLREEKREAERRKAPENIAARLMTSDLHNDISGMDGPFLNGSGRLAVHVALKNGRGISLCVHEYDDEPEMIEISDGVVDSRYLSGPVRGATFETAYAVLSRLSKL